MRDWEPNPRPRRRKKAKGPGAGWVAGGICLAVVGLIVAALLVRVALRPSNPNVTAENARKLRSGLTLPEIEAVLGKGRPATQADVLAVFGEKDPHAPALEDNGRLNWQWNVERGLVYAWQDGSYVVLVVFHKPPPQGGRQLGKAYREPEWFTGIWNEYGSLPEDRPAGVAPNGR